MKAYVDDMLVKSNKMEGHVTDLEEAFGVPKRFNMKLNLSKCAFRVSSRKFLGSLLVNEVLKLIQRKFRLW